MMIQKGIIDLEKSFPMILHNSSYNSSAYPKIFLYPLKAISGNTRYFNNPAYPNGGSSIGSTFRLLFVANMVASLGGNSNICWTFGTGATPTTDNDYTLEVPISPMPNISVQNTQWYQSVVDNEIVNEYVTTFKNNSSSSFTFSEYGIQRGSSRTDYADQIGTQAAASGNAEYFLLWREITSSPVVVPSGGSFTITITAKQRVTGVTIPDLPKVSCGDPLYT